MQTHVLQVNSLSNVVLEIFYEDHKSGRWVKRRSLFWKWTQTQRKKRKLQRNQPLKLSFLLCLHISADFFHTHWSNNCICCFSPQTGVKMGEGDEPHFPCRPPHNSSESFPLKEKPSSEEKKEKQPTLSSRIRHKHRSLCAKPAQTRTRTSRGVRVWVCTVWAGFFFICSFKMNEKIKNIHCMLCVNV